MGSKVLSYFAYVTVMCVSVGQPLVAACCLQESRFAQRCRCTFTTPGVPPCDLIHGLDQVGGRQALWIRSRGGTPSVVKVQRHR